MLINAYLVYDVIFGLHFAKVEMCLKALITWWQKTFLIIVFSSVDGLACNIR